MEANAQRIAARESLLGQLFGLVSALAAFAATAWLGYLGHPTAAAAIGGTTIAGLVGVFITGRRESKPPSES